MPSATTTDTEHFRVCDEIDLPHDAQTVHAQAKRSDSYPIIVARSLAQTVERLAELAGDAQLAIITDETVDALHGDQLRRALVEAGLAHQTYSLPAGEASKCLSQASRLWDWLADSTIARRDYIVTFGGGVVNDTGGWVASAYMRGLPYLNLPTTLLAQVDAAMGGKVAVDHHTAKNLLGAFYQPAGVLSNVAFLATLDRRQLASGLAESIKKAVIASPAYWDLIEQNAEAIMARDLDLLERIVAGAAAIKTVLVERDPYEEDLRRPLNLGHTIGHPLETVTGYGPLLHGEAVAFGMVVESRIAVNRGLLAPDLLERLIALLERVNLPTSAEQLPVAVDTQSVLDAMAIVERIRAGSLRYVLPVAFGETLIVDDVSEDEVRMALGECGVRLLDRSARLG
jgi:3-dehydroquinate synthase